ncbi:MAG: 5-nucleotidase [Gammaproteobacteria bacterium]|jgi:5'-nucleotidase|nr:5-nucleotidase [Gammaproteobacteria bacterium]
MPIETSDQLVIGISSRALFDLSQSHEIYETEGLKAYQQFQIHNETEVLEPGVAFPLVKKLVNLKHPDTNQPLVEVILVSRNSADTGLRIFNNIEHYGLNIVRAAFSNGQSPYQYISAFKADLFLSAHREDVTHALAAGVAAATILPSHSITESKYPEIRIAFDGDAVLFSDESEQIFQKEGLEAFIEYEKKSANQPLNAGPFKGFLSALHHIQSLFKIEACPIRTALVTARSAPAHERVIKTLRAWGIRIDEALFLGGLNKGEFLNAFGADFFFDDQPIHCESGRQHVATAHVPHGIINE